MADGTPTAAGPDAQFAALVAQHQKRVARLAQRLLGWRGDVDDVVQEVFLAALRGLPKFRGESSPATWLMRLTINACRKQRRKSWRAAVMKKLMLNQQATAETVGEDERERVRRAVRELPAKYREVIVLRYLEEMSTEDLTAVLGASREAVEVRLHRARQMLRERLQ